MNIVFFGNTDFSLPPLAALVEAGSSPVLVVTKPDATRGRGTKIYPAEVRLGAEKLELPCEQPADVNDPAFLERLRELKPDLGVVVGYEVMLGRELLDLPTKGHIHAHPSLLPLYRGACPIEHAMRDGCAETGVSVIRLNDELHHGDILLQEKTPIDARETAGELQVRLAELAGKVLVKACAQVAAGKDKYKAQDHDQATSAPRVEKPEGVIDWSRPAVEIDWLVRAMTPKPGAQTRLNYKRLVLLEGEVEQDFTGEGEPGAIRDAGATGICVRTGKDLYRIQRLKFENGKRMTAGEFVGSMPINPGARLG